MSSVFRSSRKVVKTPISAFYKGRKIGHSRRIGVISRLKVLILKPKIKSASEYYVVEQTYCHFSRGRSLPKSNGETGRLFSEYALIRYRIRVEVEYFIALCELPLPELSGVEKSKFEALRALYLDFGGGCTACQGDRSHDQPRRQGDRIYSEGEDGGARPFGLQGVRAFRPHFAGHQQHLHSADYQGCARGGLLPRSGRGA